MGINDNLTFNRIYHQFFKHQQSLSLTSPDRITSKDIVVVDSNIPDTDLR